ncbi:MAG: arsenite methyltransferase, partial [Candidatus Thorarchaeota archaeon]
LAKAKKVSDMTSKEIKEAVKDAYSKVAQPTGGSCCGPTESEQTASDCGTSGCGSSSDLRTSYAESLGYSVADMPESATESFAGCGNPVAIASLKEGEVVLDLGSGAGLDMFHAARKVGDAGRVIGVDMTPAMIEKAKRGAEQLGLKNVEFRLGDIEDLPVDDDSVDVIISNCVINLAPDKGKVFREAYRVLRPGGRVMVSDIVLDASLPKKVRDEVVNYTGCLGGAILEEEYLQHMRDAGFEGVEVVSKTSFGTASSAKIAAFKPK